MVMSIFLDLVSVSVDSQVRRDARRSVAKGELIHSLDERAALIEELVSSRLLSVRLEQRGSDQRPFERDFPQMLSASNATAPIPTTRTTNAIGS